MALFDTDFDAPPPAVPLDRARPLSPAEGKPIPNLPSGALPQGPAGDGSTDLTHKRLMDNLLDEGERQAEERYQMAIDEDYNDHRHWRHEDAQVLLDRGQAPLVYNYGRQTIEWISGTEKRQRKDFKVLPREPGDEAMAEIKTQLLKYTDDVNKTQWHRSEAFKRAAVCGLYWLEEGINPDPSEDIIYSGSEDWKNVIRDSRGRDLLMRDHRFLFRRKRLDIDYAMAMLMNAAPDRYHLLKAESHHRVTDEDADMNGPWYLGTQLTNASEINSPTFTIASSFDERSAYMQSMGYYDTGRRMSVDVIEAYYRVPEAVQVFLGGPMDGRIYNKADPRHVYLRRQAGSTLRDAVRMRMRVMICTENNWLWDGPSPFTHGKFPLIPIVAYRRARDGQIYGVWRGMRDLSDDTNKRQAKALWAMSSNRVIVTEAEIADWEQDVDRIREEAARPDGVLVEKKPNSIRPLENNADVQGNLAMAQGNVQAIRDIGGVTSENLGLNTSAQSGKAILAKQDQGSMTTSDLFDNYKLAMHMQGQIRLANLEQFYTHAKAIRIIGKGKPFDWIKINEYDPETGEFKNDITQRQADFEVDTQDYRASLRQAGLEQMFALLGQIATYAPQVVLSVLDLVVEGADLPGKQEWVARIRKLNGQRDPSTAPTPEELAAEQAAQQKQAKQEALQEMLLEVEIALKQAQADKTGGDAALTAVKVASEKLKAMMDAMEIGIVANNAPQVMRAADAATDAAGLELKGPSAQPPALPAAAAPAMPPEQMAPPMQPGGDTIPAVAIPQ